MLHIAGTPILPLLFTVFQAIAQVFLLCLSGYYLACKGIADKRTQKALNHINVYLFTPALLFSKVAFFLTLEKLRELWVIPLFFVFISALSGLVANLLARIWRLKPAQRNFATAASMFMNSNSLPIALMQSLVATVHGLKWGNDDDKNAMFGRALTYLVVFSTLGMMLRWSYGVRLLAQANSDNNEPEAPEDSAVLSPGSYHDYTDDTPTHVPTRRFVRYHDELDQNKAWTDQEGALHPQRHILHVPPAVIGDELTDPSPSQTPSDSDLETDSDETLASRVVAPYRVLFHPSPLSNASTASRSHPSPPRQFIHAVHSLRPHMHPLAILRFMCRMIRASPPPLLASLIALVCTIPVLQTLLKSSIMVPVRGALESTGGCSVPVTLVVLGGWFWEDDDSSGKGKGGEKVDVEGKGKRSKGVPSVVVSGAGEAEGVNTSGSVSRRRGLTQDGLEEEVAQRRGCGHNRSDGVNVSRSPSLTSLFSMLQDIWKMRPVKRQGKGAIHLPEDEDIEQGLGDGEADLNGNVEAEAGRSSSVSSLRDRQKMNQVEINGIKGVGEATPKVNQPPEGETLTIILTLLARMVIVPLLVLPMMAFIKLRSEGDAGAIQVFDDPVFILASVLLVASPPALTLAQITQKAASKSKSPTGASPIPPKRRDSIKSLSDSVNSPFERLLSRTVFWSYCVLTPPVTILCVLVGMVIIAS
ncbi:membrane transport protein-domain-containing protein [Scleroderma yunnanense]